MDISKKQQLTLLSVWLVVIFPTLYFTYTYFPSQAVDWLNVSILFVVLFVTMLLPMRIKDVDVPLDKWITIAVFLQYGVLAELIVMQLAILVLVVARKSTTPKLYRFLSNSLIFLLVSITSGFIFHITGGEIGSLNLLHIVIYGLIYAATYTILNNILLKVYFHLNGQKYSLVKGGAVGDYIVTFILLPIAISIYFLDVFMGSKSLLLLAIPLLTMLLVARSYIKSNDLNGKLAFAGEIGHELTDQLRFDEVVETFIIKLKDVIPYENAYVIDLKNEESMAILMCHENNLIARRADLLTVKPTFKMTDGLDKDVTVVFDKHTELKDFHGITFSKTIESVMTVPIKRNNRTEGFFILTSSHKNLFHSLDIKIMDILASYFMISLDKAVYFEDTINASERCGLTNLFNFNYLEKKLEEEIIQYYTGEINCLSLILLDIDHFKMVNDTYGHESGNTILIELANLLENHTGENELIARYGGEEFVVVMPNQTKHEARELAEKLRREVEHTRFTIVPDLSEDKTPIAINITISLGVATIPEDATSVQELLRNADRALYIGGKQAGRNRVGVFGEELVSVK